MGEETSIELPGFMVSRFAMARILFVQNVFSLVRQLVRAFRGCLIYFMIAIIIGLLLPAIVEPQARQNLGIIAGSLLIVGVPILLALLGIGFLIQYRSSQPYAPKSRFFIDSEYLTLKGTDEEERYKLTGLHHVERVQNHLIIFMEENNFVIIPEALFTPADLVRVKHWLRVAGEARQHDPQNPTAQP